MRIMNLIQDKETKFSYIGIALGGQSTTESAVALINRNKQIIMLDKLFSVSDVKYYLNNFAGKKNAVILVSIPENEIMLSSKWKYYSRTYDLVNFDTKMINREDWTNRYSSRGSEYFGELKQKGIDIYRFDIENMKQFFGNSCAYKERSPIDCKVLQETLRIKYNMYELPVNMMPAAQIEALMGALLANMMTLEKDICKIIGEFEGLPVIGIC